MPPRRLPHNLPTPCHIHRSPPVPTGCHPQTEAPPKGLSPRLSPSWLPGASASPQSPPQPPSPPASQYQGPPHRDGLPTFLRPRPHHPLRGPGICIHTYSWADPGSWEQCSVGPAAPPAPCL